MKKEFIHSKGTKGTEERNFSSDKGHVLEHGLEGF